MTEFFNLPPEAKLRFPAHGWIEGASGLRQLRLPILQVFSWTHPARQRYESLGVAGGWLQTRTPYRTLRQLAIALRELHVELGALLDIADEDWFAREVSDERDQALTRRHEGIERCEVLLISVFILLRRLADDLIDALRPALFEHWKSAPSSLKVAVAFAEKGKLHKLAPFCDPDLLSSAIIAHSGWLQRLRKENGVRDTLVHWPHLLQIGTQGCKTVTADRYEWTVSANLMVAGADGNFRGTNLFPILLECIAGACELMTALSRLIGGMDNYDRSDYVFLVGKDNDSVGFWPAINGSVCKFPLRT
jgi:hypothetical protein